MLRDIPARSPPSHLDSYLIENVFLVCHKAADRKDTTGKVITDGEG